MGFFDKFKPRLNSNMKDFGRYPHVIRIPMTRSGGGQTREWCEGHLVHRYTVETEYAGGMFVEFETSFYVYRFQSENDAFNFKIRWG